MSIFNSVSDKSKFLIGKLKRVKPSLEYRTITLLLKIFKDRMPDIVCRMAETGIGTDACLELGCLPMKVHYYAPIPDIKDLDRRNVWQHQSELAGINFHKEEQINLIMRLGREFGIECNWSFEPTNNPQEFYLNNGRFSYGCAASLHCMIRHFKPRHIIEAGSGMSSLVISSTLEKNQSESYGCDYTIVDPYPGETVVKGLSCKPQLVKERIELMDISFFDQLEENDILFIDSGHTVRTGGDVNFLLLDVLPHLKPGVIVHFHDIGLPYEYPRIYFTGNPQFRWFWTEAYLLQAFLIYNNQFEVLIGMEYIQTEQMDIFCSAFPHFDLSKNWSNSGSFWIRRKIIE